MARWTTDGIWSIRPRRRRWSIQRKHAKSSTARSSASNRRTLCWQTKSSSVHHCESSGKLKVSRSLFTNGTHYYSSYHRSFVIIITFLIYFLRSYLWHSFIVAIRSIRASSTHRIRIASALIVLLISLSGSLVNLLKNFNIFWPV